MYRGHGVKLDNYIQLAFYVSCISFFFFSLYIFGVTGLLPKIITPALSMILCIVTWAAASYYARLFRVYRLRKFVGYDVNNLDRKYLFMAGTMAALSGMLAGNFIKFITAIHAY